MAEDCLFANIWAPAGVRRAPVVVWVHGGAFQQGGAVRGEYSGEVYARDHGMVVVSLAYRLGVLGFLVSIEDGLLGNFGLMDQRLGLQWVQRNVEYFGGDPGRVTLMGESAGAMSVGLHLLNEHRRREGLFHRVIMQSNPLAYQYRTLQMANFGGRAFKASLDCADLECLQTTAVDRIQVMQDALISFPRSVGDLFTWGPTATDDRYFGLASALTAWPAQIYVAQPLLEFTEANFTTRLPVLLGSNQHEGHIFLASIFPARMQKLGYRLFVGLLFKDAAPKVLRYYGSKVPHLVEGLGTPEEDFRAMAASILNDYLFRCPNQLTAQVLSLRAPRAPFPDSWTGRPTEATWESLRAAWEEWLGEKGDAKGGNADSCELKSLPEPSAEGATRAGKDVRPRKSRPSSSFFSILKGFRFSGSSGLSSGVMARASGGERRESTDRAAAVVPSEVAGAAKDAATQAAENEASATATEEAQGPQEARSELATKDTVKIQGMDANITAVAAAGEEAAAMLSNLTAAASASRNGTEEGLAAAAAVSITDGDDTMLARQLASLATLPDALRQQLATLADSLLQSEITQSMNESVAIGVDALTMSLDKARTRRALKDPRGPRNVSVFVFNFAHPSMVPGMEFCRGLSCHTAELPYIFGLTPLVRAEYSRSSPASTSPADNANIPSEIHKSAEAFEEMRTRNSSLGAPKSEASWLKREDLKNAWTSFVDRDSKVADGAALYWAAFASATDPATRLLQPDSNLWLPSWPAFEMHHGVAFNMQTARDYVTAFAYGDEGDVDDQRGPVYMDVKWPFKARELLEDRDCGFWNALGYRY